MRRDSSPLTPWVGFALWQDMLWAKMDSDRSGEVDYKEFVEALARDKVIGYDPSTAMTAGASRAH